MIDKATEMRDLRDSHLCNYVDQYARNILKWNDLSDEQKESIAAYRRYLLDIPQQEEFPDIDILTYDEWKQQEA